ncbi:universal stress protein [Actinoplanes sp. NPDC051851]|uniref:universal stress protein n=1 Tax=Actinoplanes sp. NPDC051851 TaxID=3154753 RepID=UPI0034180051
MRRAIGTGIGGAGSWLALGWAAEEAETTGNRLVLVHVCAPGSPLERVSSEPVPAELELIDPGLARAVTSNRNRLGARRVTLAVRAGEAESRLVDVSARVEVLVIGAGEGGRTVRRVIRNAHCPVVVVRRPAPFAGHVVVGVDGSAAGRTAAEFAFGYAAAHGFPVAAVHVSAAEASGRRSLLTGEIAPWRRRYPDVPVSVEYRHGAVAEELIRAGARARLLVVGDKRRGVIGRVRTGDVPMAVAMRAPCPVAVVPVDRREEAPL